MNRSALVRPMICALLISIMPVATRVVWAQSEPQFLRIDGMAQVTGRDLFGMQIPLGSGPFTLELTVPAPFRTSPDNAGQQTWSSAFSDFSLHAAHSGFPRGGTTIQNTFTAAREGEPDADFLNFFVGDCGTTMCGFPVGSIGNATEALGFEGMFGSVVLPDGVLGTEPFSSLGEFAQTAAALDVATATETFFNASWVPQCLLQPGGSCSGGSGAGDIRFVSVDGTISDVSLAAAGLPGDYNEDGVVDAADYTVWRDNRGAAAGTLPNDADGGVIGQPQYDTWKANFGNMAPGIGIGSGSLSNAAVPEPASAVLSLLSAVGVLARRKRPS